VSPVLGPVTLAISFIFRRVGKEKGPPAPPPGAALQPPPLTSARWRVGATFDMADASIKMAKVVGADVSGAENLFQNGCTAMWRQDDETACDLFERARGVADEENRKRVVQIVKDAREIILREAEEKGIDMSVCLRVLDNADEAVLRGDDASAFGWCSLTMAMMFRLSREAGGRADPDGKERIPLAIFDKGDRYEALAWVRTDEWSRVRWRADAKEVHVWTGRPDGPATEWEWTTVRVPGPFDAVSAKAVLSDGWLSVRMLKVGP